MFKSLLNWFNICSKPEVFKVEKSKVILGRTGGTSFLMTGYKGLVPTLPEVVTEIAKWIIYEDLIVQDLPSNIKVTFQGQRLKYKTSVRIDLTNGTITSRLDASTLETATKLIKRYIKSQNGGMFYEFDK